HIQSHARGGAVYRKGRISQRSYRIRPNNSCRLSMLNKQKSLIWCYVLALSLASCGSAGPRTPSQNADAKIQSSGDNMAEPDQNRLFFKNLPKGFAEP